MTISVAVFVLVSALLHALWNLICKSKRPCAAFFAISTGSSVAVMTPLYLYFLPVYPRVPPVAWLLLVAAGFASAVYYVSLANAYRRHDISFVYPMARALPVIMVPAVCALIGYGEPLRPLACLGMAVIVAGCLILPLRSWSNFGLSRYRHPALIFVLLAAAGTTAYTVIDSYTLQLVGRAVPELSGLKGALFYIAFEYLFLAIFTAFYVLAVADERRQFRLIKSSSIRYPICSGLICSTGYTLILMAMQHATNVSYVSALRQVSILIGVLLGIFVLHEKAGFFKITGVAVIFAGLILTVTK